MIRLLSTPGDLARYDAWVRAHPAGSLWQSLAWKAYQQVLGRAVRIYASEGADGGFLATALVVIDETALRLTTWDLPRGPLWADGGEGAVEPLLQSIRRAAAADRCYRLFTSPTNPLPRLAGFSPSGRTVYPEATRMIDLTLDDEALLAQMKPKGRYNISVAERHGVRVERSGDIAAFYGLLKQTAARDGFVPLPQRTYEAFFSDLAGSFLLLAYGTGESASEPIAGLLGAEWGQTGIYYYGASSYAHRALMAPFLLQWESMRSCRARGCTRYDLLGIAPPDSEEDHPWRGVSNFKEKFGGGVLVYPPERQCTLRPLAAALIGLKRRLAR